MPATALGKAAILGSSALMAAGTLSQGAAADKAGRYQAQVLEQQAQREQEMARIQASRQGIKDSATMARQRALLAGNGVDAATGSPLLLQIDSAADSAYEQALTLAGGATQAHRLRQDATLQRYEGRAARSASYFKAGSTLLSGMGTAFG